MFVDGVRVGSMVRGLVAPGFRCFGGVCPTALGALDVGINVGHRSSMLWYDSIPGVAFQRPFSGLM